MINGTELVFVERLTRNGRQDTDDLVIKEMPLTIILNDRVLVTLPCLPLDIKYLAVGFLVSGGFIKGREALETVAVDELRGVVRITAEESSNEAVKMPDVGFLTVDTGGRTMTEPRPGVKSVRIPAERVLDLVKRFQRRSRVFRATGGVHSAALCDERRIIVFGEDIGRHNAIDRVIGKCILDNIPVDSGIIITSGRIFAETVRKIAVADIPVLVSKSAPTDLGVRLAAELGITLVGFARGERMNIYTAGWRIAAGVEWTNRL